MNLLDLVLVVVLLLAAVGGYQAGFLTRASLWAGALVGLAVSGAALPAVLRRVDAGDATTRLLVVFAAVAILVSVGASLGRRLGARLRSELARGPLRTIDHLGGAVAGKPGE